MDTEQTKVTDLDVEAYFDLEDFMNFAKETRLENNTLQILNELWEKWGDLAKICRLEHGKASWLAVWLPEEVEGQVDEAWASSPGQGYLLNSLAQYICMTAVQLLVPQAADGCAPAPVPHPALKKALVKAGLVTRESDTLRRRYAVLTYYPFKGGCEICRLRESCPRKNGAESFASVVLPGYER